MANRFRAAGFVASAAASVLLLANHVDGHAHQQFPISRQYSRSRDFHEHDYKYLEGTPYAYNAGGVKDLQDRAIARTNKAVLAEVGGGEMFPLYYLPLAENGNYQETNEVAKRHGVCGDPRLGYDDDDAPYSSRNGDWEVIDSFRSGQVIEIDVVIVFYHWGHFEFRLCDVSNDPDSVVTQECLNEYQLDRAPNSDDASAVDPNHRGRYFVDPPCRAREVEQDVSDNFQADPYNVKMRYRLPDIECEHCILQMHYLTGNRCKHLGYDEFNPEEWNSDCAPQTNRWIDTSMPGICGESQSYPEEFWGCSDISITKSGETQQDDDPSPTPAPVTPDEEPVTPSPVTPDEEVPVTPSPVTPDEVPVMSSPVTPDEVPVTSANGVSYLGCWEDKRGERALVVGYVNEDGLSNEACIEYCAESENMFAGTSNDYSCWCSNDEQTIYRHGESDQCTKPCSQGDTSEVCGGLLALSVYTTGFIKQDAVVPDIDGATYLGCFADKRGHRTGELGFVNKDDFTNEKCIDFCRDIGKAFAGVENDYSCWCTNDEQRIDRNGESDECNKVCGGDELQICGGFLAVTMWATGLEPSIEAISESQSVYAYSALLDGDEEDEELSLNDVPEIEGAIYLGCFEDMRMERTMEIAYVNNDDLTNEDCVEHCKMDGARYAGTQNDYSCWCGNDGEKIAQHGESEECTKPCAGDSSQVCGGLLSVTSWATGVEDGDN